MDVASLKSEELLETPPNDVISAICSDAGHS
jgi:hypothetical protein